MELSKRICRICKIGGIISKYFQKALHIIGNHKLISILFAIAVGLLLGTSGYFIAGQISNNKPIPNVEDNIIEALKDYNENQLEFTNFCPESVFNSDGKEVAKNNEDVFELNEQNINWIKENCPDTKWENTNKEDGEESSTSSNTTTTPSSSNTNNDSNEPSIDNEDDNGLCPSTTTPVLENLVINFDRYNADTGRAGAFKFLPHDEKVFYEFGAEVTGPSGPKVLPTFEYRVAANSTIYAAASGVVAEVFYQSDTQDYEIHTNPCKGSSYTVSYDHVKNVTVSKDDSITAGQVLGTSGTWGGELDRTELMVTKAQPTTADAYCPFKFFSSSLRATYEQKVNYLMQDWEDYKGDSGIYNQAADIWAGCPYEMLPG